MSSITEETAELLALEARRRTSGPLDATAEARRRQLLDALVEGFSAPPEGSAERRRYLRIRGPLTVRFRVGEAALSARALEMGLGGLSLAEHLWVIAGQRMRIEAIRLGDEERTLDVRARVVWRVSSDAVPCAGLEFVDVDGPTRRQIREVFEAIFVAQLAEDPDAAASAREPAEAPPATERSADDDEAAAQGWLSRVKSRLEEGDL